MVDNVEINGPRAMAVDTLTTVLEPLLKNYEGQLKLVENTQKSLNTKLQSVLTELASVQSTAPVNTVSSNSSSESSSSALNSTIIGPYVKKIELLRKRLDSVSYTMNRVQVRIESLQDAVTRSESAARRQQQQQAAILAAKAASILPSSTTGAE